MAYIRCPNCGQRALDVATRCPKCAFVLAQNPMQLGRESDLVVCRRCHKMIPREALTCSYCGRRKVAYRPWIIGGVFAAVAIALLGAGVVAVRWCCGPTGTDAARQSAPAPAPLEVVPQPRAEQGSEERARSTGRQEQEAPRAEDVPPRVPPGEAATPGTVVRWTRDWVNLRAGRGVGTLILRVLRPGERLEVGSPQSGWWAVYVDGTVVGYVAGSELTATPPPGL